MYEQLNVLTLSCISLPGSKSYKARADGVDAAGGGADATGAAAALGRAIGCDAMESEVFNEFTLPLVLPLFSNFGREMKERSSRGRLAASDSLEINNNKVEFSLLTLQ